MGRKMPRPAGWHFTEKDPVMDDEGRPTCRWCYAKVKPPRRSYCSDSCVKEWLRRTRWRLTRLELFDRRGGICEACGLDLRMVDFGFCLKQFQYAVKIEQGASEKEWRRWTPPVYLIMGAPAPSLWWREQRDIAERWSIDNKCVGRDPWDADHRVPVSQGGDWWDWGNLSLLCRPDHVEKTRKDGSRFKKEKK